MKILTVIGARPQFIKSAPVSKALHATGHEEFLVHTGQHYDHALSQIFFDEMGIPEPNVNLNVGSGSHGRQTGEMLILLEKVMQEHNPDRVLVYGDTNSTLAGAFAACKLHIPVAHVEAGLRSFNRSMPEEYNRVLTDHCADLLLCPSQTAVNQLKKEGIEQGVHLVGDTMYDAVLQFADIARRRSTILRDLGLTPKRYLLATVHRPYNTDNKETIRGILTAFGKIGEPVAFLVHPRTRNKIVDFGLQNVQSTIPDLKCTDPVGYLDMLILEQNARMILTDSGGIQKEAYFFKIPCVTLRPETEWVETVDAGWNVLTGSNPQHIVEVVHTFRPPAEHPPLYGEGDSAKKCVAGIIGRA
ncbi:MAG TPA: UDP-N-acetylglucosamine 2-epimerase (non-hydrolyzing) [Desulfobacteraceae bacterium]|nr:UDP-N-acetylglucosamine 2-epimerase (non-hydrolyzing) [Desulfobacteraceae bacterium]HPJ66366.1 UDP-N-acetylglucosamine 2-epimerase (non-hydrolyzing) [Desulfobacteraceae bacterium]HPQ27210.1 UDP-N-acetylglucosamine 2-epimerase (non-hydrolyzing) [Desulfobacteraceae bacterium]